MEYTVYYITYRYTKCIINTVIRRPLSANNHYRVETCISLILIKTFKLVTSNRDYF